MKKLALPLILAAATLYAPAAIAQKDASIGLRLPTQKGSMMLGSSLVLGELGFGSTSSEYRLQGSYNVSLTPKAGYFIKDNLAVGVMLNGNFFGDAFGTNGISGYHSQTVGAGIFARQYFGKATIKDGSMRTTRFFVEGGVSAGHSWASLRTSDSTTSHGNFNSATFYFMPGFNHFFTKNVALEGGLNFSHTAVSGNEVIGNANHIGINLGLQFFFGKR